MSGKHRRRAGKQHGQSRVCGGQRGHDHFVSPVDIHRPEHQRYRIGSVPDADGVGRAACRRELSLEGLDFRTEHEPSASDDAIDRGAHRGAVITGTQIDEGDAFAASQGRDLLAPVAGTYWSRWAR